MLLEHYAKQFQQYGGPPTAVPPHDQAAFVRVGYLLRLESLINVGCHFGPSDLPAQVWHELIVLNIERAYIDRVLDKRREKHSKEETALSEARSATGIPQPGGTIFPTKHRF